MRMFFILVIGLIMIGYLTFLSYFAKPIARTVRKETTNPIVSRQQNSKESRTERLPDDFTGNLVYIEDLKRALRGNDDLEIKNALDKLAQNLNEHPENTSDFWASLKYESNFSQILIRLVEVSSTQPNSVGSQLVTDLAIELAQNDPVANRRNDGLAALGRVVEPGTNLLQTIVRISREDSESEVRLSALATLATWMNRDRQLAGHLTRELLQTIQLSTDNQVRANAIQTIIAQNTLLSEKVIDVIEEFLKKEPSTENRLLVALAVRGETAEAENFSLRLLEQAYEQETRTAVKRNVLTEIVRIGKGDAVAVLEKIPTDDPALAQDAKDYLEILKAGVTDPNEILHRKSLRDEARNTFASGAEKH